MCDREQQSRKGEKEIEVNSCDGDHRKSTFKSALFFLAVAFVITESVQFKQTALQSLCLQ